MAVLHCAANSGDLKLFQYFIENGSGVSWKTKDNESSLHLAAKNGHLKICRELLKNYNFDVHARDDYGWNVLHKAAQSGDLELLQYFIETGSNIFSETKYSQNSLHLAAEKGHLKICRELLQNYNFDIHARDDDGCNVLHCAAQSGDLELLQYFLEGGSNIFSKTKNSSSSLHLAGENRHLKICKELLQNYDFDIHATDDYGCNVLHRAAQSGDLELLQYFIENGSNIFSKTKYSQNSLHLAAEKGHLKVCRELLQNYNFDIQATDDYGWNVLHQAAQSGDLELFQYFIENGSNIFSKTKYSQNSLHLAAEKGYLKICRELLQNYNFDIHARDDDGCNVLHCAELHRVVI